MAGVVAIEQDYDIALRYCQDFREAYVYSHATFSGSPPRHSLIRRLNHNAVPSLISNAVKVTDVRFITGSGHGSYVAFTGQHGVHVWDISANPPQHIAGKIVHLLSCRAGGLLGLLFVRNGATAFWGYTTDFKFFREASPPSPLRNDKRAKPFLQLDAIIDIGILNGYDAARIYSHVEAEFWKTYRSMIARSNGALEAVGRCQSPWGVNEEAS